MKKMELPLPKTHLKKKKKFQSPHFICGAGWFILMEPTVPVLQNGLLKSPLNVVQNGLSNGCSSRARLFSTNCTCINPKFTSSAEQFSMEYILPVLQNVQYRTYCTIRAGQLIIAGQSVPIPHHSQTKNAHLATLETQMNSPQKQYHTHKGKNK